MLEEDTCEIAILWVFEKMPKSDVRGRPKRNRNSPAAGNATGEFFSEEVPREIAILRSQEKFSGRSERRPESIFGGSIGWNRDSPVPPSSLLIL